MKFFKAIFFYFRNKKYRRELDRQIDDWTTLLKRFQVIHIDPEILQKASSLRGGKKYAELIQRFEEKTNAVMEHNREIAALSRKFDEIIKTHPIREILSKIDQYPLEQLLSLNETALKIGAYTLPDSVPNKRAYLSYLRDLGEMIGDYAIIVEQYTLIKDFDAISYTFGDRYIDGREAESALAPARILIEKIKKFGSKYYKIPQLDEKIIERHNEQYIRSHLNDAIFDHINGKSLDEEQRRAILCDPGSNRTIAGAGAGKTLTICGKVKWLLDRCNVQKDEILLLSYSKASADDLARKVEGICTGLTVKTFHAFGLEILNRTHGGRLTVESQFKSYIKKFFEKELFSLPDLVDSIFRFFSFYLYANKDGIRYATEGEKFEDLKTSDYRTLKERLGSLNENPRKLETLRQEFVKSYEELVIANFLYINKIDYEYERPYEIDLGTPDKRQYLPDFYLPDYDIYLEHYGVNKNWRTPQYTREEERKYLEGIEWKRATHAKYGTVCIETYSYEFHDGQIFDRLKQRLENHGVEFKPMTQEEIMNAMHDIYAGQDFSSLINLISTFVSLYKSKYRDEDGFDALRRQTFISDYEKDRTLAFLDICQKIYHSYFETMRAEHKIDFDDMILQAADALDAMTDYRYKYVIIDEFQDISQSRTNLLKAIIAHGDSKLFAVGDDWQAIYRFAGSDLNVFLHFDRYFRDVKLNYITSTHRNSMELQTIVEPFITANPEQYVKHIRSEKHETSPVRILYHNISFQIII